MSDVNTVARLIDAAGTRVISISYIRKDGTEGSGVFLAKSVKHLRGGEDSTAHIPFYKSLYNVTKKRYAKLDMRKITRMVFDGQSYDFA